MVARKTGTKAYRQGPTTRRTERNPPHVGEACLPFGPNNMFNRNNRQLLVGKTRLFERGTQKVLVSKGCALALHAARLHANAANLEPSLPSSSPRQHHTRPFRISAHRGHCRCPLLSNFAYGIRFGFAHGTQQSHHDVVVLGLGRTPQGRDRGQEGQASGDSTPERGTSPTSEKHLCGFARGVHFDLLEEGSG